MPKKTTICMIALMAMIGVRPALATDYIQELVPEAQKVGEGRMDFMVWDIYDAALFAPQGQWQDDQPYALQLTYLRNLSGVKIADRSVQEMRGVGYSDEVRLATWHTQMRGIFPDVDDGDVITGIYTEEGHTVFYREDIEIGRIKDPQFGRAFFSIWLDPKTSAPDLRERLLGLAKNTNRKNNENIERLSSYGVHDNF